MLFLVRRRQRNQFLIHAGGGAVAITVVVHSEAPIADAEDGTNKCKTPRDVTRLEFQRIARVCLAGELPEVRSREI